MLLVIALCVLVATVLTFFALNQAITAHKKIVAFRDQYPSITIIRPVKGLDIGAEENFKAGLATGYKGQVETIFVFDDTNDPAYALTQKIIEEYKNAGGKDEVHVLLSGSPPAGRTGKLHAMILAEAEAKGTLIAFADSDTRPDEKVLCTLVETLLSTPGAGAAFIPVIVDQPMQKVGDVFYALLQNALYAPFALMAAGRSRTLPFIMGQYMVFTRACLRKIGGVACASGQLVDDMAIGRVVHENGLLNVVAPYSLSIVSSGLTLREFIPIYRKWFHFGKNGLPASFLWRQWLFASYFFIPVFLLVFAVIWGHTFATIASIVDICIFAFGLAWIHEKFGGSRVPFRYFWAPFLMMFLAPIILLTNRIFKRVTWRGRVYNVDNRAALS